MLLGENVQLRTDMAMHVASLREQESLECSLGSASREVSEVRTALREAGSLAAV